MANRGWRDIVADMLEVCKQPTVKTALMLKAGFSYSNLIEYLKLAEENGLLEYDRVTRRYRTTEKGREFLRLYYALTKLVYRGGMLELDGKTRGFTRQEIQE